MSSIAYQRVFGNNNGATASNLPSVFTINNLTKVGSPADGVLQIQKAAGGGTVGATRLVLGANASSGGASVVLNNTLQRLGFMTGDASSYVAAVAQGFIYTAGAGQLADVSGNNGISWTAGAISLSGGGGTPAIFTTWDATGNATFMQTVKVQNAGVLRSGSQATPNGNVTGSPGDVYLSTTGGAGATMWVKETGSATNTGWVAK